MVYKSGYSEAIIPYLNIDPAPVLGKYLALVRFET